MLRAFRHFRPAAAGRRLFMDYREFRESIKQKVKQASCLVLICGVWAVVIVYGRQNVPISSCLIDPSFVRADNTHADHGRTDHGTATSATKRRPSHGRQQKQHHNNEHFKEYNNLATNGNE